MWSTVSSKLHNTLSQKQSTNQTNKHPRSPRPSTRQWEIDFLLVSFSLHKGHCQAMLYCVDKYFVHSSTEGHLLVLLSGYYTQCYYDTCMWAVVEQRVFTLFLFVFHNLTLPSTQTWMVWSVLLLLHSESSPNHTALDRYHSHLSILPIPLVPTFPSVLFRV